MNSTPAPPDRTGESATSSGTVARTAMLLRVLAEADGDANLTEIAERVKLPASTTHRLLALLQVEGFVDRGEANRTYRIGLDFLRLSGLVTGRAQLPELAHRFMQTVVETTDQTCSLSVYLPRTHTAMLAKAIHGKHPLRYEAQLYAPSSLVWGATGRGILAFLPDDVIDDILSREDPSPATGRKPAKPSQLKKELAQIREAGYAYSHGQKIPGAVGLSAPIFNARGVVAALCMTIPESRFDETSLDRLACVLMAQASEFSRGLGWRASHPESARPAGSRARQSTAAKSSRASSKVG